MAVTPDRFSRDRRKNKDFWTYLFMGLNFLAWLVLLGALIVFHRAQPEYETVFDRFFRLTLRTTWDQTFVQYLQYTIGLGLSVSMAGLALSLVRARRRTDHRIPLMVLVFLYLALFSAAWLAR